MRNNLIDLAKTTYDKSELELAIRHNQFIDVIMKFIEIVDHELVLRN